MKTTQEKIEGEIENIASLQTLCKKEKVHEEVLEKLQDVSELLHQELEDATT